MVELIIAEDYDIKCHLVTASLKLLVRSSRSPFASDSSSMTLFEVVTNLVLNQNKVEKLSSKKS